MVQYRFRPDKKLSQFFCIKPSLLDKMVEDASINSKDIVLEIGPGTGFLTERLLKTKAKIIVVEKDKRLAGIISDRFAKEIKSKKLTIIEGDFLEQDIDKLKVTKIVALPPYHLSSRIILKIVNSKAKIAVLMLDNGFVQKLTAFEGLKEYTTLSVLANLNGNISILKENISGENFFPTPNCHNAIIKIEIDTKNNSTEFYHFIKEIFRYKNKDLSRSLRQAFPFMKRDLYIKEEKLEAFISDLDLADVKVNLLTPEQLLEVFEGLRKWKSIL